MQMLIVCRDVDKTFLARDGETVPVFQKVSLEVSAGSVVALVGASGAGKTTLLRLIAGLETPDAGSISVRGKLVERPSSDRVVVFQDDTLLPWRTVGDNVRIGLRPSSGMTVERALEMVRLPRSAERWPRELSGGERRRVEIARALSANPDVLLLDEPFASLDTVTRKHLHETLLEIWRTTQQTVILSTHDLHEAVAVADRIVVVSRAVAGMASDVRISSSERGNNEKARRLVGAIRRVIEESARP